MRKTTLWIVLAVVAMTPLLTSPPAEAGWVQNTYDCISFYERISVQQSIASTQAAIQEQSALVVSLEQQLASETDPALRALLEYRLILANNQILDLTMELAFFEYQLGLPIC